ncbi:MAG: endonuclease/exonuclease/phosphatase family protein [Marinifilaceae bacterium]
MKKLFTVLRYPLYVLTLLVSILFIVSSYGGYLSPMVTGKYIISLSLVFPVILLVMIGLMVMWWLISKRICALLLIVFAVCLPAIWSYVPLNIINTDKDVVPDLKVLSYNIHNGGKGVETDLCAYIVQQNADIVALQEFVEPINGTGQVTKLLKKHYPFYKFSEKSRTRHNAQGLALFSKYPIKNSRSIGYESRKNSSVLYTIDMHKREMIVVNNHFESTGISNADRSYLRNLVEGEQELREDVSLRVINTLATSSSKRASQADTVSSLIKNVNLPIIVCGDFNDTPLSYTYRVLASDLQDAYINKGAGPGFTFDTNPFMVRIDHILYNNGLKALTCRVPRVDYSDHYPIVATFAWEKK